MYAMKWWIEQRNDEMNIVIMKWTIERMKWTMKWWNEQWNDETLKGLTKSLKHIKWPSALAYHGMYIHVNMGE